MPHAVLRVRLQPRASRDALQGIREDGVLLARVSAPPVDGRANDAVVRMVARALHVPTRDVVLVRGQKARDKTLRVEGLDDETVRRRLSQ